MILPALISLFGAYLLMDKDKTYAKGGSTLLAPNGKRSNLTPEQWKLVRTPEFKAWFGDWENDPDNASKVVDENGEPLVVYRTTKKEDYHNDFLKNKYVFGIYFSEDKNSTNIYGQFTKEYFLNIKNPKLLRGIKYDEMWVYSIITKDKYKNLKDNNNDGAIWKRQNVFYELVVFEPNQIKLADGSNTTFDANNPDIRYVNGGKTNKNKYYRAEISNEHEKTKTFIPTGFYEAVGENNNPIIKYDEYVLSKIPELAASKNIYGAILGAASMFKFKNNIDKNTILQIYELEDKPEVDISHWTGADFPYLNEVRYRRKVIGKHILEYKFTDKAYKLIKDFYDYMAWLNEVQNDNELELNDKLFYISDMIDSDTFIKTLKKNINIKFK